MNYDSQQKQLLSQAKACLSNGEDPTNLPSLLSPNNYLVLKCHLLSLPEELAKKTIFGKAHWVKTKHSKK